MTVDYTCFTCGFDHGPRQPWEACPHVGRSAESMAHLRSRQEAEAQKQHYTEKEAQFQRDSAALKAERQRQDEAERRERSWAKTSALLKDVLQQHRCQQEATRQAAQDEAHDLLVGKRYMDARDERARLKRLIERFGS